MNIVVIFAGGTGARMNTRSRPKQFLEVHGKPILVYTIEKFNDHPEIDRIILVCLESWIDYAHKLVAMYNLNKVMDIIPGGENGFISRLKGMERAYEISNSPNDVVMLHDGVRPMINEDLITNCIESVNNHGSAITTAPAVETIFINGGENRVGDIFNRSLCRLARAPQCFILEDAYKAHKLAVADGHDDFIDTAMLMQHYGAELHMVDGPMENIKITTPTDFYLFRALLDAQESMQIIGL